jgi:hypothetical protein
MVDDHELSEAIRGLGRSLCDHDASPTSRAEAIQLLRQANQLLASGETREPVWSNLSAWSGTLNPVALPLTFEYGQRQGQRCIVGRVRIDRFREGPAGSVHGGVVAGLFDEMMGAALRLSERPAAVTGRLTVRYRRPTPLDEDLVFRSWISEDRPLRMRIESECLLANTLDDDRPVRTAEADGLFLRRR